MSKDVLMQPVAATNVLRVTFTPNGDGSWTIIFVYQIQDNVGTIWKQGEYKTTVVNGAQTLNQVMTSALSAINIIEGL